VPIHGKYSKKVFIGGIPTGTQSNVLFQNFCSFGGHTVDWPKRTSHCQGPPSGYAFLVFESENSIEQLLINCVDLEGRKIFEMRNAKGLRHPVEVKVWELENSFYMVNEHEMYRRFSVFVGGIPRTCAAVELAHALEKVIGRVVYSCIELDHSTQYPKGAACVYMDSKESYVKAIAAHKVILSFAASCEGNVDRQVELLPYLMSDMSCERCNGVVGSKFCCNIVCLSYYCNTCWKIVHGSHPNMMSHVPMKKGPSKFKSR